MVQSIAKLTYRRQTGGSCHKTNVA